MIENIEAYKDTDTFVYGQTPITKLEYLELYNKGVDLSSVRLPGSEGSVSSAESQEPDRDMSSVMNKLQAIVEKIVDPDEIKVKYRYNSGRNSTEYSPLQKLSSELDETAFIGWLLYELGFVSSDGAVRDLEEMLSDDKFDSIGSLATSDDTADSKLDTIKNDMLYGDIIMFDNGKRNALAGLYVNSGQFVTLVPSNEKTDVSVEKLYTKFESGELVPTVWLDRFNGTIYRPKLLNRKEYVWYNSTINN